MDIPKVIRPVRVHLLVKEPLYHLFLLVFSKFMDESLCVFTEIVFDADLIIFDYPKLIQRSFPKHIPHIPVSLGGHGNHFRPEEHLALDLATLIHRVMEIVTEKRKKFLPPSGPFLRY